MIQGVRSGTCIYVCYKSPGGVSVLGGRSPRGGVSVLGGRSLRGGGGLCAR